MTASGRNFIRAEVNRNKRAAQRAVAPNDIAGMPMSAYEIVMICIASVGLILKLIRIFTDRDQKQ